MTFVELATSILVGALIVVALGWALALIAWALTWLSILHMRWTDPKAYERFRILRNLHKGAWKR